MDGSVILVPDEDMTGQNVALFKLIIFWSLSLVCGHFILFFFRLMFFCPAPILGFGCVHQLVIFLNAILVSLRYYYSFFISSF